MSIKENEIILTNNTSILVEQKDETLSLIENSNNSDLIGFITKILDILSKMDVFIFGDMWCNYIYWNHVDSTKLNIDNINVLLTNDTYKLLLNKLDNLSFYTVNIDKSYDILDVKKYDILFKNNIDQVNMLKYFINNGIVSNNTIKQLLSKKEFKYLLEDFKQNLNNLTKIFNLPDFKMSIFVCNNDNMLSVIDSIMKRDDFICNKIFSTTANLNLDKNYQHLKIKSFDIDFTLCSNQNMDSILSSIHNKKLICDNIPLDESLINMTNKGFTLLNDIGISYVKRMQECSLCQYCNFNIRPFDKKYKLKCAKNSFFHDSCAIMYHKANCKDNNCVVDTSHIDMSKSSTVNCCNLISIDKKSLIDNQICCLVCQDTEINCNDNFNNIICLKMCYDNRCSAYYHKKCFLKLPNSSKNNIFSCFICKRKPGISLKEIKNTLTNVLF